MKKILQAFDGATTKKPVQGANDMKKFVSIIRESSNPYTPAQESVITSFEEGSVGGDANAFLLAADTIQDEVMAQVNKIKINADEANLRDMMEKFNAFMTAYHNVGKGILQPDMFNDSMGESTEEQVDEAGAFRRPGSSTAYDRDYASSVSGMGKRDSLAYQQDGGANDEGWDEEPKGKYQAPQDKPKMTGMFFYNVQPGQEQEAASLGVKKTKSGKWAKTKYSTSGRSFGMQKDLADKAFGVGKWWAPKNESIEEGTEKRCMQCGMKDCKCPGDSCKCKPIAGWVPGKGFKKAMEEAAKQTMSRAAKGNEKYGKDGMKALAKAGREGASDEKLDKIRNKYDNYNEDNDPCWDSHKMVGTKKKGGKTVPNCVPKESVAEGLSFKDYLNLAEAKKGLE